MRSRASQRARSAGAPQPLIESLRDVRAPSLPRRVGVTGTGGLGKVSLPTRTLRFRSTGDGLDIASRGGSVAAPHRGRFSATHRMNAIGDEVYMRSLQNARPGGDGRLRAGRRRAAGGRVRPRDVETPGIGQATRASRRSPTFRLSDEPGTARRPLEKIEILDFADFVAINSSTGAARGCAERRAQRCSRQMLKRDQIAQAHVGVNR